MSLLLKRINKLAKSVADKIAAGEVVDRPLSIVKEMMENSIDAGASSIVVEIKNGGKSYVRVTDNGSGILGEDLELAFQRHATSKVSAAEDLISIKTLGFRGEALASISAVSRIEVITKTSEEKNGNRLVLEGGEVVEKGPVGCPDGTTIVVSDLFYNTPARLKFMKKDAAESNLIIDFVSKMALAYPAIKIRLINNGATLFFTPGKGDIYTNILTVYSREVGDKLIHVKEEEGDLSIEAYISPPNQTKSSRKSQIFFVNGRNISNKLLESAVSDAYREKLPEGRYPIAFLFLYDDPSRMDVNIHPNKKEIRFDNEDRIRQFVSESLRKGLFTEEALPEIKIPDPFRRELDEEREKQDQVDIKILLSNMRQREAGLQGIFPEEEPLNTIAEEASLYSFTPPPLVDTSAPDVPPPNTPDHNIPTTKAPIPNVPATNVPTFKNPGFRPDEITVTGAIFGTYLTGMDETHFYLIDQHAAHERVFYERLLAREKDDKEEGQQMILTPFVVEVTYGTAGQAEDWLPVIKNMGYGVEEFGPKSYIIKGIPMFMELGEARNFLDYFLENMDEIRDVKDPKRIDKLIMNACKSAVKAGDPLNHEEMVQLMKDLAGMENPFSCPHGRPVFLRLSKSEIERMFKRT